MSETDLNNKALFNEYDMLMDKVCLLSLESYAVCCVMHFLFSYTDF